MNTYIASYKNVEGTVWYNGMIEAPNYEVARNKAKAVAKNEGVTYCVIERINRDEALDWIGRNGRGEGLIVDHGPNRDSKGNWIGNVANENGWTP